MASSIELLKLMFKNGIIMVFQIIRFVQKNCASIIGSGLLKYSKNIKPKL